MQANKKQIWQAGTLFEIVKDVSAKNCVSKKIFLDGLEMLRVSSVLIG